MCGIVGVVDPEQAESLVRKYLAQEGNGQLKVRTKPAHIVDLEDKLCRHLGTRVQIDARKNGQRGKIVIEFDSLDEFDRITEALGLACREGL